MIFGEQWVPMEVMNTIFALWAVAVVIVVALLLWLRHVGRKKKSGASAMHMVNPKKQNRRKKR
ncbi:MAG: hypothetical protein A3I66_03820 [Burkholderiales bacterium RIFCSPLOWO2_02_FULL_57_36]|nr:MAG: hypothetical protein A3I66_03820 [Burkholderiales bacterium RIFCSPLOWO2_02_FULL_57_36]